MKILLPPSVMQARTAGSMPKASLFSEACNISTRHEEATRLRESMHGCRENLAPIQSKTEGLTLTQNIQFSSSQANV